MKAVVAAFNQEKALVGAFSVITNLRICFGWNFLEHYLVRLAADDVLAHGEVGEGVRDAGPRQPHHLRHRVVQVQHVGTRPLRHPLVQQSRRRMILQRLELHRIIT